MEFITWTILVVVIVAQVACFFYLWSRILKREERTRLYLEEQKRVLLGCVQSIESNQKLMVDAITAAQAAINAHVGTTATKVGDIWTALREQKMVADNHDLEFRQAMNTVIQGIDTLGGQLREVQSRPAPRRVKKAQQTDQGDPAQPPLPPSEGFPEFVPEPFTSAGMSSGDRS